MDDVAAGGGILQPVGLSIISTGHHLGYKKTWLVIKNEQLKHVKDVSAGTGIQITSTGHPYLGAAFGWRSELFCFCCPDTTQCSLFSISPWFLSNDIFFFILPYLA